ncbi:chemotaxis protein CheW [Persephonella sp. IF05-L8]|uniref:chemotaxis protein CheW n=1 Tax=Persephonella sp. IF05-L8 TaxID=1158338 RepID=UPI0004953C33
MKVSVLEFTIGDSLFGIQADYIKLIFDVEIIKDVDMVPDYVIGITRYGENVYPLICTARILEMEGDFCNQSIGKTAIVVKTRKGLYALLVDEIIKIQEIEKTDENSIINFYKEQDTVLEEITPKFIEQRVNIPSFFEKKEKDFAKTLSQEERAFVLSEIEDRIIGFDIDLVKKVEDIEELKPSKIPTENWVNRVYSLKNMIIKTGNLRKLLNINEKKGENLILLSKDNKILGIEVDKINDFAAVPENEISISTKEEIFDRYFIHNGKIVSVIANKHINNWIDQYALKSEVHHEEETKRKDTKEILLIKIGNKRFALKMDEIVEVLNYEDVKISTYPTKNPYIKGIMAFREKTYYLISFETALNQKIDIDENTKILIFQKDGKEGALIISEIEDILSVPEEKIIPVSSESSFIDGAFISDTGDIINFLNPNWIYNAEGLKGELVENAQ